MNKVDYIATQLVVVVVVVVVVLLLLLLLHETTSSKNPKTPKNRIGMAFGGNVHEDMHPLPESDFRFDVIIRKWRPYFTH